MFGEIGKLRDDGEKIQCHICGKWFKTLAPSHLFTAHQLTADDYREQFDLNRETALCSQALSAKLRDCFADKISDDVRKSAAIKGSMLAQKVNKGGSFSWRKQGRKNKSVSSIRTAKEMYKNGTSPLLSTWENRDKMIAAFNRPETKAAKSASAKARYKKPDERKKNLEILSKARKAQGEKTRGTDGRFMAKSMGTEDA